MFRERNSRVQKKGNITVITKESLHPANLLRGRRKRGEHISHTSSFSNTLGPVNDRELLTSKRLKKDDGYSFDSLPSIYDSPRLSQNYKLGQDSAHSTPTHIHINSSNGSKRRHVVADVPIYLPLFARRNRISESTSSGAVSHSHQHTAARMSHGASNEHTAARMSHGNSHQHTAVLMPQSNSNLQAHVRLLSDNSPQHSDSKKINMTIELGPVLNTKGTNGVIGNDRLFNERPRIKFPSFDRNNMNHLTDESGADIGDRFPKINDEHTSRNNVIWFPDAHSKRKDVVEYNDNNNNGYGYRTGEYLSSIENHSHSGGKHIGRPYQVSPEFGAGNGGSTDRERNTRRYHQFSGPKYDSRYDGQIRQGHGNSQVFSE